MYEILTACRSGMDLLIIWLLYQGYSQRETARALHLSLSTVQYRIDKIRDRTVLF